MVICVKYNNASKNSTVMEPPKYYAAIPLEIPLFVELAKEDLDIQPGKNPIETNHHISVHVMLPNKPSQELEAKLAATKAFAVTLDTLGCFENKDNDVLFIKVNVSDQLLGLHKLLVEDYKIPWRHPEYTPHVTLAFLKRGTAKKYVAKLEKPIMAIAGQIEFRQHASASKDASDVKIIRLSACGRADLRRLLEQEQQHTAITWLREPSPHDRLAEDLMKSRLLPHERGCTVAKQS